MNAVKQYFRTLTTAISTGWNRFWFTAADPFGVSVLRWLTGFAATYYLLSHTADLMRWFGPTGLLTADTVRQLTGGVNQSSYYFSPLYYAESPAAFWMFHAIACIVALAFTVGFQARIANILTLLAVLSYAHRAPMITGQFEPVLTMMLFYLCLSPSGAYLSVDAWLARRGQKPSPPPSTWANIAVRLIQVHLTAFYLLIVLMQLAGEVWWNGEAVWLLIARTETRLVDISFLHQAPILVNLWTHAIVAFELAFAALIWNRTARPLMLALAIVFWSSLALITGLTAFCAIMVFANMAFASPQWLRGCCASCFAKLNRAKRIQITSDREQRAVAACSS